MRRIRKGDMVIVLSGDDKGKMGKIKEIIVENGKVIVEGVAMVKKATRQTKMGGQGGLVEKEMPIPWSKVALYDGKLGKGTRVRMGVSKDGKKVRVGIKEKTVFD